MTISVTPIPRLIELVAPAFTLGTSNAAGSAITSVASDSTLLAFDATVPDAITFGQSGAAGVATVTSRRDHAHAMAANPSVAASQAEMEAASSTTVFDTPGRTQYHPGVAKAWALTAADGESNTVSYNMSSVTDGGTGARTYVFDTDFSTANYAASGNAYGPAGTTVQTDIFGQNTQTAGSIDCLVRTEGGSNIDVENSAIFFGDQ